MNKTVIGPKTAIVLYTLLIVASFLFLKRTALYLALLIIIGLALKSLVDYLRRRMD